MAQINLDVVMNDFKEELKNTGIKNTPNAIEKRSVSIALRDFNVGLASTIFIRFLTRFCDERNLVWFIDFESRAIIIG